MMKTGQMAEGWPGGSLRSLWRGVGEDEGTGEGTLELQLGRGGIEWGWGKGRLESKGEDIRWP